MKEVSLATRETLLEKLREAEAEDLSWKVEHGDKVYTVSEYIALLESQG